MPMLHPISLRALLTSSILALALGGCSFHYSSGSAPPSKGSNHTKHPPKKSSSKKVDNSEKPLYRAAGEKPLTKVDNDEKPAPTPTVDPTPPPKREEPKKKEEPKPAPRR